MSDNTIPVCTFIDPFGYPVSCYQMDPCVTESNTTLWAMAECDGLVAPMTEFCLTYPDHPACVSYTETTVEVGIPPTLPNTGQETFYAIGWGTTLVLLGLVLRTTARRK